jgi:hypothetical protein
MRNDSLESSLPLQTRRLKFVIERLLARLFHSSEVPWLLKGGFAMDLRYRPHARATKDVDLSISVMSSSSSNDVRDSLQDAADIDLGDYMTFRIGELQSELTNAPQGGGRFLCEAIMLGKVYAKFHIDVGFGDAMIGEPERLIGDDLLEFAGLAPAVVFAIPKSQQFAEKVHAYTFPWTGRINTRTKDLIDLVLLIERGQLQAKFIQTALAITFQTRKTHPLPKQLPPPPDHWKIDFPLMATEAALSTSDHLAAFSIVNEFWSIHSLGGV